MTTDKNGNYLEIGDKVKVVFNPDYSLAVFNGAMGVVDSIDKIGQCCILLNTNFLNSLIVYNRLHNTDWKTENPFYFFGEHLIKANWKAPLLDNE